MNIGLIFGLFAVVFVAGIAVAEIAGGEEQGVPEDMIGTEYNYEFVLNHTFDTCDLHWLRPRLYYEMGRYPDQMYLGYPIVKIGFFEELSKEDETELIRLMTNDTLSEEICNYPSGATYEMTTRIHPEEFSTNLMGVASVKPIYHVDEFGNLTLLFIEPISGVQLTAIDNNLKNMWEVTEK